jgi:hypothetical protein
MGAVQRHLFGRLRRARHRLKYLLPNSAPAPAIEAIVRQRPHLPSPLRSSRNRRRVESLTLGRSARIGSAPISRSTLGKSFPQMCDHSSCAARLCRQPFLDREPNFQDIEKSAPHNAICAPRQQRLVERRVADVRERATAEHAGAHKAASGLSYSPVTHNITNQLQECDLLWLLGSGYRPVLSATLL